MTSLKLIKQDLGRASLGVWVEHPLGYRFRVARMGNDSYRAAVEKLLKPHRERARPAQRQIIAVERCHHLHGTRHALNV